MSPNIDSILERLARYEERLDATERNLKQLVDQRIGLLKRKVKQIRIRILRGHASTRELSLAHEPLPLGTAIACQDYVVTRHTDQNDSALPQGGPAPSTSTGRKRKRASNRRDKRRQNNRGLSHDSGEEGKDGDNSNSGVYKIRVINQNCPEGCRCLTLQTRKQYHDHLRKEHGLLPFKCLQRGCGHRFRST